MSFRMLKAFSNRYGPVDQAGIDSFCKEHDLPAFPEAYRDFLLQYNGGVPATDVCRIPKCDMKKSTLIVVFLGIHKGPRIHRLEYGLETLGDRFPKNLLPIGDDEFGNVIGLHLKGRRRNHVYIWLHDQDFSDTRPHSWENIYLISEKFEDFQAELKASGLSESPDDPITALIRAGDVEALDKLLSNGLSPDTVTETEKCSLAETAASYDQVEIIQLLEKYQPSIQSLKSAVFRAIRYRNPKTLRYLLEMKYMSPEEVFPSGFPMLRIAAEDGTPEIVRYLIEYGCPVNQRDSDGYSPLVRAAFNDEHSKEIAELLIQAGAVKLYPIRWSFFYREEFKEIFVDAHCSFPEDKIRKIEGLTQPGVFLMTSITRNKLEDMGLFNFLNESHGTRFKYHCRREITPAIAVDMIPSIWSFMEKSTDLELKQVVSAFTDFLRTESALNNTIIAYLL